MIIPMFVDNVCIVCRRIHVYSEMSSPLLNPTKTELLISMLTLLANANQSDFFFNRLCEKKIS